MIATINALIAALDSLITKTGQAQTALSNFATFLGTV